MENSAVNMAHQQQRRAESLLRCHRFTEAIECHERACDLLSKAEQETDSASALESLRSQREYHFQQKNIIWLKQTQMERLAKAAKDRERLSSHPSEDDSAATTLSAPRRSALPDAIYREMEEADSLLSFLMPPLEEPEVTSPETPRGQKLPKEMQHVTEELRLRNQHLRQLVEALVAELDARTQQVDELQRRLNEAHSKLGTPPGISPAMNVASPSPSSNTTPSSDASGSPPLLVSPFTELVPDGTAPPPQQTPRNLPQLAPLEMPQFDFSQFRPNISESRPSPS